MECSSEILYFCVLPEFKLIWLVSELFRLCAELCNEFKLLASLSINLFAASNLANKLNSDVGKPSTVGAVVPAGPSIIRIELLLSPSDMVKVMIFLNHVILCSWSWCECCLQRSMCFVLNWQAENRSKRCLHCNRTTNTTETVSVIHCRCELIAKFNQIITRFSHAKVVAVRLHTHVQTYATAWLLDACCFCWSVSKISAWDGESSGIRPNWKITLIMRYNTSICMCVCVCLFLCVRDVSLSVPVSLPFYGYAVSFKTGILFYWLLTERPFKWNWFDYIYATRSKCSIFYLNGKKMESLFEMCNLHR